MGLPTGGPALIGNSSSVASRLALVGLALASGAALAAAAASTPDPVVGTTAQLKLVEAPPIVDGLSAEQQAEIAAKVAALRARRAPAKAKALPRFPFFPQAGVQGRDLFLINFTDLDPAPTSIRDWDCSDYTYDGHRGHDSMIRSFREQAIGVPIFAVLPGVVAATHDGEPDTNVTFDPRARANFVAVEHDGYTTYYLHMKLGSVAVSEGQQVAAGTQLGLTGSSGISTGPHLHLETHEGNQWREPSAGPCRDGESWWAAQPPVDRDLRVADFYLAPTAPDLDDNESFLRDETPRTGTFVRGRRLVGIRADLRNVPADASYRIRVLDPRGRVVYEESGSYGTSELFKLSLFAGALELPLDTLGSWRAKIEIEGSELIDAPFRVVASAAQAKNRKPNRIAARMAPARPVAGEVMTCVADGSPIAEDPDYDLVSYRYEWRVDNRLVRLVTSAATSDLLPADAAPPGSRVSCRVTPSDGKAAGTPAVARAVAEL
jgi:murein DD-endopeptidase MepM/ murein hydrolase activator NlpD